MPTPLPVFKIISGAFTFLWEKKLRMIRALSIPITVVFISDIFPYLIPILDNYYESIPIPLLYSFSIGIRIISAAAQILFAITCHRLVLIGNTGVPEYGMLSWTRREWWFLAFAIILPLVYFLSVALYLLAKGLFMEFDIDIESFQLLFTQGDGIYLLMFLVALPSVYIFSRLSLLLPATAVDRDVDVGWAWKSTKTNGWRLTVIIVLLPLLFVLLLLLLLGLLALLWGEVTNLAIDIISSVLSFIPLAIGIVALSLSYKHLSENQVVEAEG